MIIPFLLELHFSKISTDMSFHIRVDLKAKFCGIHLITGNFKTKLISLGEERNQVDVTYIRQNQPLLETQINKSIKKYDRTLSSQPNVQRHPRESRKRTSHEESASSPCSL
jgi:hypothetical protein